MRIAIAFAFALAVLSRPLVGQEPKPVPKDSVRVLVPGCTKGYIFTAGRRTVEEPGSVDIPPGMHFRMNGPKKMLAEIKAHEGSMIQITGVMKRGQFRTDGVGIGGGVRVSPGTAAPAGSLSPNPTGSQLFVDIEAWRPIDGTCPSR
jgi:hypothetical protein